jgi:membrane dipeptidase
MNRRTAMATLLAPVVAPAILRRRYALSAQSVTMYSERAIRLVRESPVVDMLCQLAKPHPVPDGPPLLTRWLRDPRTFTEEHFARVRESGLRILALGAGPTTLEGMIHFCAEWNGFIASHADWFFRVDDPRDLEGAGTTQKVGIVLSTQNADYFRGPGDVQMFHALGQRVAQLTYNYQNLLGAGFLENSDGGLTVLGHRVLEAMQEAGMAVDVSHCGDRTTLDALAAARKPIIFTHASCRALVPGHLRCKTDEMIRKLAGLGGVMGIPFVQFIVRNAPPVTVEHVVDHFEHVARLVGVEHVGIGSDLDIDGFAAAVRPQPVDATNQRPNFERYRAWAFPGLMPGHEGVDGLRHHRRVFDLTEALIRRGFDDREIRLMLGGNVVRVLTTLWS